MGDEGFATSQGLSSGDIDAALSAILGHVVTCGSNAKSGSYRVSTSLVVGCDGRVSDVAVVVGGGLPMGASACIEATLMHAEFPAHDLPEGLDFDYNMTFRY
jgi:2-polyprenyl-6-methoxyphenol hydroxylase-like FAD-dependent oxidoreductase